MQDRKAHELQFVLSSDRNSRAGNEEREIRAGSKISRPEREKAGNDKEGRRLYIVLPPC